MRWGNHAVLSQCSYCHGRGSGRWSPPGRFIGSGRAKVVIADIDKRAGPQAAREIRQQGGKALFVLSDVSSEQSTSDLATATLSEFGGIHILINNAAQFRGLQLKLIEELLVAQWDQAMNANLRGLFLAARAALAQMKGQRRGKIVAISSSTVFSGAPRISYYVASKAGLIGFTRCLAREVGEFGIICANVVEPGLTETDAARRVITAERFDAVTELRAIARRQTPDDLVSAALFLCAPASDFITGRVINVDGGQILH